MKMAVNNFSIIYFNLVKYGVQLKLYVSLIYLGYLTKEIEFDIDQPCNNNGM